MISKAGRGVESKGDTKSWIIYGKGVVMVFDLSSRCLMSQDFGMWSGEQGLHEGTKCY